MSGILPIGLGRATRLVKLLSLAGKEYVCLGRVHSETSPERLAKVLKLFEGRIYQRPPVRSSVKRAVRVRTIYKLEVLEISGREFLIRVRCQAGTYMRKLCYDVGEVLGTGAHMVELRRTGVGPFTEDDPRLVYLHEVWGAYRIWREEGDDTDLRRVVRPMEEMVPFLPVIVVRDTAVDALCHGASLAAPGVLRLSEDVRKGRVAAIFTKTGEIVGLMKPTMDAEDILKAETGIVAEPFKILMKPGTYPRFWKSFELKPPRT